MTIRNQPKRRTTITPEMLEILAKGIRRRRHQVAVARAMFGITFMSRTQGRASPG